MHNGISMKKNILFVVHNLKVGGIQKITLETAKYYAKQGYETNILLLDNTIELNVDFDCNIHTLNLNKSLIYKPWLAIYYAFYKVILRNIIPKSEFIWASAIYKKLFNQFLATQSQFDAIFVNGARSMHRLSTVKHERIVYSLHLPYTLTKKNNFYYNFLLKKLFTNKKLFTVSDYIRMPLQKKITQLNIRVKALETIYNPCDIDKTILLAEEPIDFDEQYVLGVGRFSKQKRFDRLIDAYFKANIPEKLVLIGDGSLKNELKKQVESLGISDKVVFKGFDLNPYRWMKKAKLFILSSDNEGFVLVVNEALVCGTPVVATDCGPIGEILTGSLKDGIAKKNSDDLALKIQSYMENPIYPEAKHIEKLSFDVIVKQQLKLAGSDH